MYSLVSTVPYSATRPTSFRPRSTSMTCSARSLSLARSSSSRAWSSSPLRPRRRVPAIGRTSTPPSVRRLGLAHPAAEACLLPPQRTAQAGNLGVEPRDRGGVRGVEISVPDAGVRHHLERVREVVEHADHVTEHEDGVGQVLIVARVCGD